MSDHRNERAGATPSDGTTRSVVWLDGRVHPDPATATVRWDDHGLTVGDGVFETIELRHGSPFALERHLDRLERSAGGLLLDIPDRSVIRAAVDEVADMWGTDPARLRITYTAGPAPLGSERGVDAPTLIVAASPMTVRTEPTRVITVDSTRNPDSALCGLKTTSYAENVVALRLAVLEGASEAIFANTRGELCEGTGSNIVIERDGVLATPPLSSGCLAGITRDLLLEALDAAGIPVEQAPIPMDDLMQADGAFLLSTGRHVQPISHVDGNPLPLCPGPATRRAAEIWASTMGALRGEDAITV